MTARLHPEHSRRRLRGGARAAVVALVVGGLLTGAGPPRPANAQSANDPLFAQQWGLAQVRAPEAWRVSRGAGAVIAVIDSGIDLAHPDLAGKLVPGYDFLSNSTTPDDLSGHGTHVAAIAAAATGNGTGIAGVAPDARIMPLRALDAKASGSAATIALAVDFAVERGADVINLSLGRSTVVSGALAPLLSAIARANAAGVVVVAAAGNDRGPANAEPLCASPASAPGVVCVAATDKREQLSSFSNLPAKPDALGLSAPGGSGQPGCDENVLSAVRRGTGGDYASTRCPLGGDYAEQGGTSQAAPFVSGVAALLAARGMDRTAILNALTTTSRQPVTGQRGQYTRTYGYGIVDAAAALGLGPGSGRSGDGYFMAAADGGIFNFGAARFLGSAGGSPLSAPTVTMAANPDGRGYLLATADGAVFSFGTARFHGSAGGRVLSRPIVAMAMTPDGGGYWLVASDGGILAFGNARFLGSTGGVALRQPIVGMASTPDGGGYWLVASDGGIFAFGNARFLGSTGAIRLNRPILGMASTPDGGGYWLVASDGGIFAFGNARFHGSTGAIRLNQPIVGMSAAPDGGGYWLVASDGGIFSFGNARFHGSTGAIRLNQPIVAMAGV